MHVLSRVVGGGCTAAGGQAGAIWPAKPIYLVSGPSWEKFSLLQGDLFKC